MKSRTLYIRVDISAAELLRIHVCVSVCTSDRTSDAYASRCLRDIARCGKVVSFGESLEFERWIGVQTERVKCYGNSVKIKKRKFWTCTRYFSMNNKSLLNNQIHDE